MSKNNTLYEDPLFDSFFDPVDAEPFLPDPARNAAELELLTVSRMIEQTFQSIALLLIREYRRVFSEGAIRRRAEIVRRSVAAGCFVDAPLDRKARRDLLALEEDIRQLLSAEQMEFFLAFRQKLMARYDWSIDYTRKFCSDMNREKLREWITVVYDE